MEMTHVRTSPYYPQGNGKLERYNRSVKSECIRKTPMVDPLFAIAQVDIYANDYNKVRLHSAIGYVAPFDKLQGREIEIFATRKQKLIEAKRLRLSQQTTTAQPIEATTNLCYDPFAVQPEVAMTVT